jgi:hypothetical protein
VFVKRLTLASRTVLYFNVIPFVLHYITALDIVRKRWYDPDMQAVDAAIKRYLQETLGVEPAISRWVLASQLPYFLQDAYEFRCAEVLRNQLVLAIDRHGHKLPGRDLRVQLARVAALADLPVVYVVNSLASHERRRLVEQKIPFIVPGNQLYLPMLGIDLREHFRRPPQASGQRLSPATQAILIAALMRKLWLTDWAPSEIAAELGYGPMTSSRAVRELTASRIAALVVSGRHRLLRLERPPADLWEDAKPVLRSPIMRSVWAAFPTAPFPELDAVKAGQSALALCSMLDSPKWPTYAVSASTWKKITGRDIEILAEPEQGASEWQVWSYSPALALDSQRTVDPLSLTLSLRDSPDERIQIALDELKKRFPWSRA